MVERMVRVRVEHYYNFYFRRRAFSIFLGVFRKRLRAIVTVNGTFSEAFLCTPLLIQKKITDEPAEPI